MTDQPHDWNKCLERVGKERDRAAFSALFTHFSPLLKSFLLRSGGQDGNRVEELVQEVMIKVWRKAENYSASKGAASTWIYTIARNTRIDFIRQQVRQNLSNFDADDVYGDSIETQAGHTPHASLVKIRNQKQISISMKELPAEQEEVLRLMYFQGKSGQQVAEALDLPLGTVKSRIRLAMAKMKLGLTPMRDVAEGLEGINS